ncbi:Tat pathway signal sequence domain protein [Zavarzinia sp. CC-PAN008]|uniref:Tat pathway signal sequence domain protein n=1 Tax=Zavarzinia sp. CC-PAN008 TaxID=3243332 RepID=UPI003F7445D2
MNVRTIAVATAALACGALGFSGATLAQAAAPAAPAGLKVELNKLEDKPEGCRAYMVFENPTDAEYQTFRLDLVLFAGSGEIARRIAVDAGPLRANKTTVKLFDLTGLACTGIGSILLNDVAPCASAGGEVADCVSRVTTASRLDVKFQK